MFPDQPRIARWGIGVVVRQLGEVGAAIEIKTQVEDPTIGLTLISRVKDDRGRAVTQGAIAAAAAVQQALTITSPQLWSPERPKLYTLETELRRGTAVLDRATTPFGVRIVTFDTEHGMAINGVPTKLRGGCIHHDNGLLGAASFDAAEERKVQLLKARGYNAVRPSHNLFSAAFLNACDRHGLLVGEETFDVWREPKLADDYSVDFGNEWLSDLRAMVLSTRNHPSIIMWSIGNEIPERNTPGGVETHWRLANEVHKLDPSRPVTAAINGFPGQMVTPSKDTARPGLGGVADQTSVIFLDIVGYNYKLADYEADHRRFPNRVLFGTESFANDTAAIWDLTDRSPWLIGDFVWTAMDYLGEAGIGGSQVVAASGATGPLPRLAQWPWVNAFCGDIDLIGQQKPSSREGMRLTIRLYTAGDRVELHLNGRLLASKPVTAVDLKRIEFTANYAPGILEAVAFRNNHEIARRRLTTVGAAAAIRLTPERPTGGKSRGDISYVALELVDAAGRPVPDASKPIDLAISGPAELIAFGSANPLAVGSFQSPSTQTWNGRALAIVRGRGSAGRVDFTASSEGLKPGSAAIRLS